MVGMPPTLARRVATFVAVELNGARWLLIHVTPAASSRYVTPQPSRHCLLVPICHCYDDITPLTHGYEMPY